MPEVHAAAVEAMAGAACLFRRDVAPGQCMAHDDVGEPAVHPECALAALVRSEAVREVCGRCNGKGSESWQKTSNPADGREDWPCVRCQGRGWTIPPIIRALAAGEAT